MSDVGDIRENWRSLGSINPPPPPPPRKVTALRGLSFVLLRFSFC